MNNKMFEQMQEIVKSEPSSPIIILTSDKDRGAGKTHNLKILQQLYGVKIACGFGSPREKVRLIANEHYLYGRRYDPSMYVLDEGYSIEEVKLLSRYYNIAFALVYLHENENIIRLESN